MLEKPDLDDGKIVAGVRDNYGLDIKQVDFLPLGADRHTAVYRVVADDATAYFLKLRGGVFDPASVLIPRFLYDQGIAQIIAPIPTQSGQLWSDLNPYKVILYPFVEGRSGFEVDLSDQQWIEFGAALKAVHRAIPPSALMGGLQHETYSPQWRESVPAFQARVERENFDDPVSAELAALLRAKRAVIGDLVERAERLGAATQARALQSVLCHADIHAGNILIAESGALYLVDWDTLIVAPKERDLMFVGGGLGGGGHTPEEEETLFYRGYGETQIDPVALVYYRYERIVQDIAAYCEQILLTDGVHGDDRVEGLRQLTGQFEPGEVIEMAYAGEKRSPSPLMFRGRYF